MTENYLDMSESELLARLKVQFSADDDALEIINRAEADLEYINSDKYKGMRTPKQVLL